MENYWQYRHLRTAENGVVTVAYHKVDRYTYTVCFGFCSPEDTFCKKRGREMAVEGDKRPNRTFTLHRPEGYPLDHLFVDFLGYFYGESTYRTNRNQYLFESEIRWPRWLPKFVNTWRSEKYWEQNETRTYRIIPPTPSVVAHVLHS